MRTIGLIGGMSWESTVTYYQIINETIKSELGGLHSAKIILHSVDFAEIEELQAKGEWEKSGEILADIALKLEKSGADFVVICTNTMHKVAEKIERAVSIPLLHIADETAKELRARNIKKIGLLGTKYTMTQDFYKSRLESAGLQVIVPDEVAIEIVNDIIYSELCLGKIYPASRNKYIAIVEKLRQRGAEGVILGCTEIGLLLGRSDVDAPLFDTTKIHAARAALRAIQE